MSQPRPHLALVKVRTDDERHTTLVPGDLIGRSPRAALCIDDGRVSEAHAMVSLRGDALRLLALRGWFAVQGRPSNDLALAVGQQVHLAEGVALTVTEVLLPSSVLALVGEAFGQRVLTGSATLLPDGQLVPGAKEGLARVWSLGTQWRLAHDGVVHQLHPGIELTIGAHLLRVTEVSLSDAARHSTLDGRLRPPLGLVARFDTVHIHREGVEPVVLSGLVARLISELVALDGPAHWSLLAAELWRDGQDRHALRRKWDVLLVRTRAKLKEAGIRTDLVRASGAGQLELLLMPGDTVEDQT